MRWLLPNHHKCHPDRLCRFSLNPDGQNPFLPSDGQNGSFLPQLVFLLSIFNPASVRNQSANSKLLSELDEATIYKIQDNRQAFSLMADIFSLNISPFLRSQFLRADLTVRTICSYEVKWSAGKEAFSITQRKSEPIGFSILGRRTIFGWFQWRQDYLWWVRSFQYVAILFKMGLVRGLEKYFFS